jgi:hypothetical protein
MPALVLVSLLPLLQPGLPPLTDLPGHVARWHIATAPDISPLHLYFSVDWVWVGNLGTDLLALPLIRLFGPIGAGHAIAIMIVALNVGGMLCLARSVHGRISETGLFALPLAFAWPFQMGFVNFELAQGLALLAIAGWISLGRLGRGGTRVVLSVPVALILWTCHSAGWGLLGLLALGTELAARREQGDRVSIALRNAIIACLPLAAPLLPMLLAAPAGTVPSPSADWFNLPNKLLWIASTFRDRWQWVDLASLGVILFLLYVAWRDPRLRFSARLLVPAGLVAGAFLILPRLMMGGAYVDMRLVPAIWMLLLLSVRPAGDPRLGRVIALAGMAFILTRTTAVTWSYAVQLSERRADLSLLSRIPRGSAVLALNYRPCLRDWADGREDHLPAFAIIERDAFVNEQWAIAGQHILNVTYTKAGAFQADPSQHVYPSACAEEGRSLTRALTSFPRNAFDYVWLSGIRLKEPRRFGLETVWGQGRSMLYEVVGSTALPRVERDLPDAGRRGGRAGT